MINALKVVGLVMVVRFAALGAFSLIEGQFEHTDWISRFYLPAGVNVLVSLAFGPMAAVGVGLGSFAWNLMGEGYRVFTSIWLAAASGLSCYLTLTFFARVFPQWDMPLPPRRIIYFILAYSTFNSILHNVMFLALPGAQAMSVTTLAWMFIGDFVGAVALFLSANVITSLVIHARALRPRL
jgi:hypothetical protein